MDSGRAERRKAGPGASPGVVTGNFKLPQFKPRKKKMLSLEMVVDFNNDLTKIMQSQTIFHGLVEDKS